MISLLIGGVLHSSPDAAVLLLTVGLLLVCVELNRPGWIVPGGVGLLLLLFAVASLLRLDLSLAGAALLATAAALLLLDLLRPTPPIVAAAATITLILGFAQLVLGPVPRQVHTATAIGCGLLLGVASAVLTRIARRARANKAVD